MWSHAGFTPCGGSRAGGAAGSARSWAERWRGTTERQELSARGRKIPDGELYAASCVVSSQYCRGMRARLRSGRHKFHHQHPHLNADGMKRAVSGPTAGPTREVHGGRGNQRDALEPPPLRDQSPCTIGRKTPAAHREGGSTRTGTAHPRHPRTPFEVSRRALRKRAQEAQYFA